MRRILERTVRGVPELRGGETMKRIEVYTDDAERIEKLCEENCMSEYELIQILLDAVENGDIDIG